VPHSARAERQEECGTLRRGYYELGVEARHERLRLAAPFDGLVAVA
jgi:hypothetical protein